MIMDYNRVIVDLNGHTDNEFFDKLSKIFIIEEQANQHKPAKKGEIGMYHDYK